MGWCISDNELLKNAIGEEAGCSTPGYANNSFEYN